MSRKFKKHFFDACECGRYYGIKEHRHIKFLKKQLINKNGAVCAICGKTIPNMKDCTIDHILPKSKGGLTVLENCRLAHRKCNMDRGNRTE